MNIYRASYRDALGEHKGYEFFVSRRKASQACADYTRKEGVHSKAETTLTLVQFKPTRTDVVALLNRFAGHADNG